MDEFDADDALRYAEEEALLAAQSGMTDLEDEGPEQSQRRPLKRALQSSQDLQSPSNPDKTTARTLQFASQTSPVAAAAADNAAPSAPPAKRYRPTGHASKSYLLNAPRDGIITLPVVLPHSGLYRFIEVLPEAQGPESRAVQARASAEAVADDAEAMDILLRCVEASRRKTARDAAVRADAISRGSLGAANLSSTKQRAGIAATKWTDAYAPGFFHQLLSSERVNRNVLRWIRMWSAHRERVEAQRVADRARQAEGSTLGKSSLRGTSARPKRRGIGLRSHSQVASSSLHASSSSSSGSASSSAAGSAASSDGGLRTSRGVSEEVLAERARLRELFGPIWNIDARVILLVGPAGVGKTMLAHIAARQAGMEVMELNASDDRSASRLKARLHATMQMQSLTASGKQRLVILDEVDGLDAGAVELLAKMIQATPPITPSVSSWQGGARGGDGEETGAKSRRRRKNGPVALTCPVICTCNELYVPSLRKLREHCQVIEMRRPAPERLYELLRRICRDQRITPTTEGITTLADRCGYDIRSCINTLQAIPLRIPAAAAAGGGAFRLSSDLVMKLPIGAKDDSRSSFDVWSSVFSGHHTQRSAGHKSRGGGQPGSGSGDVADSAGAFGAVAAYAAAQRRRGASAGEAVGLTEADVASLSVRSLNLSSITAALRAGAADGVAAPEASEGADRPWQRRGPQSYARFLLQDLSTRGMDVGLLLDGLHENYPSSPHTDPHLVDAAKTADWISCAELFTHKARQSQSFGLNRMVPVCATAVHLYAGSDRAGHKLRARWPAGQRRMRSEQQARDETIESFLSGRIRTGTGLGSRNKRALLLDTLSPLLTLVSPPLRARNTGLLNSRERRDMADAVGAMAMNGLVYSFARRGQGPRRDAGGGWNDADGGGADGNLERRSESRLVLAPPIDMLVRYEGYEPFERGHRVETADVMKELLAQEVRLARVRLRAARAEADARRERRKAERHASGKRTAAVLRRGEDDGTGEDDGGAGLEATEQEAESEDDGEDAGPLVAAAALQAAISGRSRQRRVQLGSGNVSLPEHVQKQIKEAAAGPGASQPAASQAVIKAIKSPNTAKALRSQGFLAQLREKHTKAALQRSTPKKLYPIYFKFQEGFTNAVKRPVTLEELLGPVQ